MGLWTDLKAPDVEPLVEEEKRRAHRREAMVRKALLALYRISTESGVKYGIRHLIYALARRRDPKTGRNF